MGALVDRTAATADTPATPRRLWSKLVAGGLAAVAIVVLGVSVADGMSALAAYRATSTTTVASVVALSADTDPSTGATAAVVSESSTSNEPPATPALASPANGAVVDGDTVKLVWRGVKDPSGVIYRVDIQKFDGTSYLPLQTIEGLTGTAVGHAMTSTFERWRVTAVDGRGYASAPSGWWTFSQRLTLLTPSTGLMLTSPTGLILQTTSTSVLY
ncbi:MAG: hypothetical protein ACYCX3_10625 [Thermoleophilia bacterium]